MNNYSSVEKIANVLKALEGIAVTDYIEIPTGIKGIESYEIKIDTEYKNISKEKRKKYKDSLDYIEKELSKKCEEYKHIRITRKNKEVFLTIEYVRSREIIIIREEGGFIGDKSLYHNKV